MSTTKALPATVPVSADQLVAATITTGEATRTKHTRNIDAMKLIAVAHGLPAACAHIIAQDCSQATLRLYRAAGSVTVRRGKRAVYGGEGRVVEPHEVRRMRDAKRSGGHVAKATQRASQAGEVVEVLEHPLLDLLNDPNDYMSATDLEYLGVWAQLIAGEAFEAVNEDGTELWPLLPQYTNPIPANPGDGSLIAYYAYGRDAHDIEMIPAEQVLHFKFRQNPRDPYHGYGPLHDVYDSARVLLANTDFDLDTIKNGNVPAGIINLDKSVYPTADSVRDFMAAVSQATQGVAGKSKVIAAVGASGQPFTSMSGVGKDLQTMERLEWHKGMVRRAFGVPETVLDNRASAYASAEQGDDQYQGGTIRPLLWRRAEQRTRMLQWFGVEPGELWFAYDDPVLSDRQAEANIAAIEVNNGLSTINEYRAETGREPIEGGDVPRINGVPLDEVGGASGFGFSPFGGGPLLPGEPDKPEEAAPVAAQKVEETALNGAQIAQLVAIAEQVSLGTLTSDAGLAIAEASFPGIPPEKLGRIFSQLVEGSAANPDGDDESEADSGDVDNTDDDSVPVGGDGLRLRQREVVSVQLAGVHARPDPYADCAGCRRTKDDDDDRSPLEVPPEFIGAQQAAAQTAALRAAAAQMQAIVFDFMEDAKIDALAQVRNGSPIDLTDRTEQLATLLEDPFREMYRAGFDFGGLELDEGSDLDPFDTPNGEAIAETQTSLVRQFSADITDHAAQSIEARVRQAFEAGDSIDDIAKDLAADQGFSEARAERIARTETSRAANYGKLARYKEAGITTKYSVTAPGATAVHQAIARRAKDGIPMDEPFVRAGETIVAGGERETFDRDCLAPPYRPNCRCSIQTRPNDRSDTDD